MRRAAIGALVSIGPYDWYGDNGALLPDDRDNPATHIQTVGTRGGTVYEIVEIRRVIPRKRLPRGCKARYTIKAIKRGVVGVDCEHPSTGRTVTLKWNARTKQRRP